MTRLCFAGVTGWTAPPIITALDQAEDLELVSGVSRSAAGREISAVTASSNDSMIYSSVSEAVAAGEVDVLLDFTSALAVMGNVRAAIDAGVHVVIGSSGLTASDYELLDRLARERSVGILAIGNFSIMAAILHRAAEMAARYVDSWEIIDYASAEKPDVPSGTSRELAERLAKVRRPAAPVAIHDLHGPVEARGAEVSGSRIHSIRLPSFVVSTEIVFASPGDRLTMRHDPGQTPDPYVPGVLAAVRAVAEAPGLRRGMDSILR
jgi:4-hydroxy-tetrahydrodipicolinate reductase